MYISRFRVKNAKCFCDSGEARIRRGLNIFVGTNNSGKSALLQSLRLLGNICFDTNAVRFEDVIPYELRNKSQPVNRIEILLTVELTDAERKKGFASLGVSGNKSQKYFLSSPALREIDFLIYDLWSKGQSTGMSVERVTSADVNEKEMKLANLQGAQAEYYGYRLEDSKLTYDLLERRAGSDRGFHFLSRDMFPFDILFRISQGIYYVSPHRVTPASQPLVTQESLAADATNLHQVLHTLANNNRETFERIERFVCDTFEDIVGVETPNLPHDVTAINLVQRHTEFKIPLAESGTGIEQVLAIATVAISSKDPRVILIDEPHAFLHPKAEKKLLALLEQNPHYHQYIVATHSPIWINRVHWGSLHWVLKKQGKSNLCPVLTDDTKVLESIFRDLGIENSDWTSADMMIFVEGESDEKVYRVLLSRLGYKQSLTDVVFAPIAGIGRVRCKKRNHFFRLCSVILNRISKLPVHYFFVFDRHEEDERYISALKGCYAEKIQLLPRYEVENFLLEPEAVSTAIEEEVKLFYEDESDKKEALSTLSTNTVNDILEGAKKEPQFYPNGRPDPHKWENSIKASSLLDKIYRKWKLSYDKTSSGPRIARHLSQSHLDSIRPELDLVFEFL